uniref:RNase H type-1 domain-containing protein n=1 Tax=Quercus lobata TaxID=97700 RepID=A0A7N2LDM8_QUELO
MGKGSGDGDTTMIVLLIVKCISQALEYYFCVGKAKNQRNMVIIPIRWNKPPPAWCKLNTDGASLGNPGKSRGGIIRDSVGNWIKGFSRSIGITTSITAEF